MPKVPPKERHGHKGRQSKVASLQDVPLIDMTEKERTLTMAHIGRWPETLAVLRQGGKVDDDYLVRLLLVRPGQPDVLVVANLEHGDGEGCRFVARMKEEIEVVKGALVPGETLRMDIVEPTAFRPVPWPEGWEEE